MTPVSRISSILRSIRELSDAVHVAGATPPARALILAQWALEQNTPCVVLCSDDDRAAELASDIESLSQCVLGQPLTVEQFPTWEQSPYSPIAPSLRTRFARLSILSSISRGQPPRMILTSLPAFHQATIPPEKWNEFSTPIRLEESIVSRETLGRKFLEGGYLRVETVEDPGTFAIRGELVDVFPADRVRPVRIELFGDVVDRIREFDPGSQTAVIPKPGTEAIREIILPPAREVLINSETTSRIRERLKAMADEAGVPRSLRDPILASIREGTYPDHSDAWAPFAYRQPSTFWSYLGHVGTPWPVAIEDEFSVLQQWDRFLEDQERLSSEAAQSGVIVPPVEQLFPHSRDRELEKMVRLNVRLFLDRLEIEVPEGASSSRHRVFVESNSDLSLGSRRSLGELEPKLKSWANQGYRIVALASTRSQLERIRFLLEERDLSVQALEIGATAQPPREGVISLGPGSVSEGFRWPSEGLVVLSESEILGSRKVKKGRSASSVESGSAAKNWSGLQALSDLSIGDAVVHLDHGIGIYRGLVRLDLSGAPSDFLLLEYANRDKLYLPVYRLNLIQKYIGSGEGAPLDRLGSQHFTREKERVRDAVRKLAIDLVQLYAERKIRPGFQTPPRDNLFWEFESKFWFEETPDQLKAIEDTLSDMESGKVMDRLVCGDVGYGKTEVAIRAAFRMVMAGKQVALLVPTTILAHQHEQSFKARMGEYPITIESISRFKPAKQQKAVLEDLKAGKIDIIIGTHRLLSKDVQFKELGLVIVDEEHRFGVEHKERLKTFKVSTHVLTLTATPIPRTLHMALSGLRDISLMNTPPVDRLPIRTYVSKLDDTLIRRAVEAELSRGGQVFFVHNRVQTIYEMAANIREAVPQASVIVAHGQMPDRELEEAMIAFYEKKANVLLCTSIIESGLDVPSANTVVINRADTFGLAQLYQIRGRVGRGQNRAYAYLLLPAEGVLSEDAKRRLEVIQRFVELGSGFSIASHDLEIRGGGDLLGPQQSGHIAAVGFDLYTELLDEAIREIEGKPRPPEDSRREPEIKAPFPAFLGEEYVPDVHQRLSLYRRFSAATSDGELTALEEELKDRFGALPEEAQNLLWLIRLKQLLKSFGVELLTVGPEKVSLVTGPGGKLDPAKAIALVSSAPGRYQILPNSKFVATVPTGSLRDLLFSMEKLFAMLR